MHPKRFATITVDFERKLEEKDLQEIENKLREFASISNFTPNTSKLTFSISSDGDINYSVIDELKKLFQTMERKPRIYSTEYAIVAQKEF